MPRTLNVAAVILAFGSAAPFASATADQSSLSPVLNAGEKALHYDWPAIEVGTGEYEEGPTGVTVFRFPKRAVAAVDVRGGGPGTVNTDYLRLGYEERELDAVVFSGGSWYGLESTTAVGTALKDDGIRNGDWTNLALSVGAIIYDLGDRRLNEIYPDKRLAQAALRATRAGVFPLGAHGAGRFAKTGGLFGCNAYSGQGGAFRQIGDLKIAAFVVVNAMGVITTRDGRVAACFPDAHWPKELRTADLLAHFPASAKPGSTLSAPIEGDRRNTTVSLIVVNRKMTAAQLQRLATHVHSSMSRAIQPFSTEYDGDVLYAVSTDEIESTAAHPGVPTVEIDVTAAEVMWDAILASVPEQPTVPPAAPVPRPGSAEMNGYSGTYVFSPFVSVRISASGAQLFAQAVGARAAYSIGKAVPVELHTLSPRRYDIPGRYPTVLDFTQAGSLVVNPGHWQQVGRRASP